MRPIAFRAWVPSLKEMIQPCYLELFQDGSFNVGRMGVWTDTINDKTDEIILMQQTDLIDKNNKYAYEGDIVECKGRNEKEYHKGVVKFEVENWCEAGWNFGGLGWHKEEIEIIGNIHQHSGLL